MMDRRWPAWAALWSTWTIALLWVLCLPSALEILEGPPTQPGGRTAGTEVATAVIVLAAVQAPCGVLIAVSWGRWPRVVRAALVVAGLALLASAAVWPGVPGTGPLYVVGTGLAGATALAAAARPGTRRSGPEAPCPAWVARVALLVSGAVVIAGGLRGLAYWHWRVSLNEMHYPVAVALGVSMLLLALLGHRLAAWQRRLRWVVVAALGLLALLSLAVGLVTVEAMSTLRVPEEAEIAWGIGTPLLLLGAGLLAGAVAARRCWWQVAALSVSSAVLLGVLATVRESTIRYLV